MPAAAPCGPPPRITRTSAREPLQACTGHGSSMMMFHHDCPCLQWQHCPGDAMLCACRAAAYVRCMPGWQGKIDVKIAAVDCKTTKET